MNFTSSSATRWFSGLLVALAVVGGLLLWRGHLERRTGLPAVGPREVATPVLAQAGPTESDGSGANGAEADTTAVENAANDTSDEETETPVAIAGGLPEPLENAAEPDRRGVGSKEGRGTEFSEPVPPASGKAGGRSDGNAAARAEGEPGSPDDDARGRDRPVLAADRPLNLPVASEDGPPPPPGRAYLKTGSIPVERSLLLDGAPVNSFSLDKRVFLPGRHEIRLESSKGCITFSVELKADETVHLIWDFDMKDWRRNERVTPDTRVTIRPPVSACKDE